ncbi:ankyrin repeat domain-containing protein 45 [Electrophorus electricus]|uniref:ankyrin repeat domain-containing protein 45 n=1 Tax=Electrophorus electricus TaxID=8005 RepID=UPI0015CFEB73|nr:ankyrin repeat domain-containing protein 45 [Electrophorus electricus]
MKMQSRAEKTVFSCALEGDAEGLQYLIDEESPDMLRETDDVGRSVLAAACMLDRSGFARELVVKHRADVNAHTARGYSPLHCSAMWGQLDTLKTLLELGADPQAVTFRSERAIDLARRYSRWDCVDYLAWAEAKQSLQASINEVRDILAAPERVQGKLSKEDKNICLNTCSAKSDWIQNVKNPTIQDLEEQKKQLEDVLSPILAKLKAQAEAPLRTSKN